MLGSGIKNLKINNRLCVLLATSTLALNTVPIFEDFDIKMEDFTSDKYIMQNDYVLTTSSVNLRSDDGLYGEIICNIEKDEELRRILSHNDWDLVIYKDKIGFVSSKYIEDLTDSNSDLKIIKKDGYVVAKTGINLRLGPSMDDKIIGSIGEGVVTEVLGKTDNSWYLVFCNGKIGFVSGEYVDYKDSFEFSKSESGKLYAYTTSNVNFRYDPTLNSEKILVIGKGEKVEVVAQTDNGWFEIVYNGIEGYISDGYITFNPCGEYRDDFIKVVYATEDIDLKNELEDESYSTYRISKYETCEVLSEIDGKYFVRCDGYIGYIPKSKTATLYNTFVVVDIDSQRLTLYNNNEIILETDIVTGQKYEYDTPTGMYSIRKKTTDTYLSGEDYFTHVDYWMPFNGGIGLHDASWRSKFGGNIYEKNGSHGCINIPAKYADDVYYNVEKGTKVLVQK